MSKKGLKQLQREYIRVKIQYAQLLSDLETDTEVLTEAFLDKEAAYHRYTKALQS